MLEKFKSVPIIKEREINSIVGFNGILFRRIGINLTGSDEYYGFTAGEYWNCPVPNDCIKVTHIKYMDIFNIK